MHVEKLSIRLGARVILKNGTEGKVIQTYTNPFFQIETKTGAVFTIAAHELARVENPPQQQQAQHSPRTKQIIFLEGRIFAICNTAAEGERAFESAVNVGGPGADVLAQNVTEAAAEYYAQRQAEGK